MAESSLRIVVTGLIAQHPRLGGVTWDYLQFLLGLRLLGHDVYYLEDSGEWPYELDEPGPGEDWIARDPSANVEHLGRVLERFGFGDRWAYRFPTKPAWYGMPHRKRREVLATADLLLNVSGTLHRPGDYREIPRLAYLDTDPVFTQIRLMLPRGQLKFQRRVAAHDVHFSYGELLPGGAPETAFRWRPARQPVVLSEWRPKTAHRDVFTTVMSWTSYRPVRYRGRTFAQKDVELQRYLELPRRVRPASLEVALGATQHAEWETGSNGSHPMRAADLLVRKGWGVVDAERLCGDLDGYRAYVESSKGEWSVAKNGYVAGRVGWFSSRSTCYLAAGRPVVVQDTGFGSVIPTGEGILTFSDEAGAAAALEDVEARYAVHARAARELAAEYFDSRTVLARLVEEGDGLSMARVLLSSWMVRYPLGGNLSWALQWLVGFHRLGHDVYLVEDSGYPGSCYDPARDTMGDDCSYGTLTVASLLARLDLEGRWCYRDAEGRYHGLGRERVEELFASADLYLDMGAPLGAWREEAEGAAVRVALDTEPAFTQIKLANGAVANGAAAALDSFDFHYTVGQNIGTDRTTAPGGGRQWRHVFNPVVPELFEPAPPHPAAPFTTVMNWCAHEDVEWGGRSYGQKDAEFERFVGLPGRTAAPLELAVSGSTIPRKRLLAEGWRLRDAHQVSRTVGSYLDYISASAGEFGVCKEVFVATRSGWFSDRSAAYLASGRPVVLQDTGFAEHLPCGEGLFAVSGCEEAADAIARIVREPARHADAARAIAREHLDARVVLPRLLAEVGVA